MCCGSVVETARKLYVRSTPTSRQLADARSTPRASAGHYIRRSARRPAQLNDPHVERSRYAMQVSESCATRPRRDFRDG